MVWAQSRGGAAAAETLSEALPAMVQGFQVLRRLGRGAASDLLAVFEPRSRQVYALKRVVRHEERDQRHLDQAEREFAITSRLDHPGIRSARRIVRVRPRLRVGEILLLLDFVDGEPLDRVPAGLGAQLRRFAEVARTLSYLHAAGIVHADLKPGNMLVDGEGRVVLIDFGQACEAGQRKERIQGTPGFMAPEQAALGVLGPATDAFGLAATMVQTLLRSDAGAGVEGSPVDGPRLAALVRDPEMVEASLFKATGSDELGMLAASMLHPQPHLRRHDLGRIAEALDSLAAAASRSERAAA
jgi:serine/threonine protein kinase